MDAACAWSSQLLDVVNLWHPSRYLLLPELAESFEVEMPKLLVPSPSYVVTTGGEADRLGYIHM